MTGMGIKRSIGKAAGKEKEDNPPKPTIPARYLPLQEKHKLPPFEQLNADFDLDTIEPDAKHLVKEVAKKIFEQIETFRKTLELIMQPETSILSMQEAEMFSEEEHERINRIARKLMSLDRQLLVAELDNHDEGYAAFIRTVTQEWPGIKGDLMPLLRKMRDGWDHQVKSKRSSQQYLG